MSFNPFSSPRENPVACDAPTFFPEAGDHFYLTWKRVFDRSYTYEVLKCVEVSGDLLLAQRVSWGRGEEQILLRGVDCHFHPVSPAFLQAMINKENQ